MRSTFERPERRLRVAEVDDQRRFDFTTDHSLLQDRLHGFATRRLRVGQRRTQECAARVGVDLDQMGLTVCDMEVEAIKQPARALVDARCRRRRRQDALFKAWVMNHLMHCGDQLLDLFDD